MCVSGWADGWVGGGEGGEGDLRSSSNVIIKSHEL